MLHPGAVENQVTTLSRRKRGFKSAGLVRRVRPQVSGPDRSSSEVRDVGSLTLRCSQTWAEPQHLQADVAHVDVAQQPTPEFRRSLLQFDTVLPNQDRTNSNAPVQSFASPRANYSVIAKHVEGEVYSRSAGRGNVVKPFSNTPAPRTARSSFAGTCDAVCVRVPCARRSLRFV